MPHRPAFDRRPKTDVRAQRAAEKQILDSFATGVCKAPDCRASIPRERIMCSAHWELVPEAVRERVISQFRLAQNGHPGAADTYRRACLKAIDSLAKKAEKPAIDLTPAQSLQSAQLCAFAVLEWDEPLACDIAWWGFYTVLQGLRICPARLGISLRKWNEGGLRDRAELRAEIEGFVL